MGHIEKQEPENGARAAVISRWHKMKERIRQLVRIADWALTVLFIGGVFFTGALAVCLCYFAFKASPLLGLALAVCAIALLSVMWSKKQKVGGLLSQAQAVVDGQVERIADMLRDVVDETLSSVALSFAVIPGAMVAAAAVAGVLSFGKLAVALVVFAGVIACFGACIYTAVRFFAMHELERVVSSLKGEKSESTPLIG